MNSEVNKDIILTLVNESICLTRKCREIEWNENLSLINKELLEYLPKLLEDISNKTLDYSFYSIYKDLLEKYNEQTDTFINNIKKEVERRSFGSGQLFLGEQIIALYNLFSILGCFNSNIVIVGANGSGKTTLAETLKANVISKNNIVLSAQKMLIVPHYSDIPGTKRSSKKITELHDKYRTSRGTFESKDEESYPYPEAKEMGAEFRVLLDNLIAKNNELVHDRDQRNKNGESVDYSIKSDLERCIEIWGTIIKHRRIECSSGYDLKLTAEHIEPYSLNCMSDGEKIVFYNIAFVIQAPQGSVITIDEPEMFLHKTVSNELWNILEDIRSDCRFIYLTHDLEFAIGRAAAKKLWLKDFTFSSMFRFNHKWDLQELPSSCIPDELLLRLLGSRKTILFCEGKDAKSLDKQVYEILFPNLSVIPVNTCKDVIDFTKAYNKISSINCNAIGIVDTDYRLKEEIDSLSKANIYTTPFSEIENIFLAEEFLLDYMKNRCDHTEDERNEILTKVKDDILSELDKNVQLQVSNFVSSKINYYYSKSHVRKSNTKEELKDNLLSFNSEINIEEWYCERENKLKDLVSKKNYHGIIKLFNNKGLCIKVHRHLNIGDYNSKALRYLKYTDSAKVTVRNYFHTALR